MKLIKLLVIFAVSFLIIFALILTVLAIKKRSTPKVDSNKEITLYYWGLFEPESIMADLIKDYQKMHPNITIVYQQKKFDDDLDTYKKLLNQRLKEGKGPDIFRIHSTWVFDFLSQISFSNAAYSVKEYKESFYPVMVTQCVSPKGDIVCVPLMYDGLVLYYNKDMFNEHNVEVPKTWGDLSVVAKELTKYSDNKGGIEVSGVAFGTGRNVDYSSDLLTLLYEQSGVKVPDEIDSDKGKIALQFYTNFSTKYNVWNLDMPNSKTAFAIGRSAMYFGKLQDLFDIKRLNPTLNIGMAQVPQLPTYAGGTVNKTWASYWVETVSNDATEDEQKAAWDFLKWLSEPDQEVRLYKMKKEIDGVGTIPSNSKLYDTFRDVTYIGPVLSQAPIAVSQITSDKVGNSDYSDLFKNLIDRYITDTNKSNLLNNLLKQTKDNYNKLKREHRKEYR